MEELIKPENADKLARQQMRMRELTKATEASADWGPIGSGKTDIKGNPFMYKLDGGKLLATSPAAGFQECDLATGEWKQVPPTQAPDELAQIYGDSMQGVDRSSFGKNNILEKALKSNNPDKNVRAIAQNPDNWTEQNTEVFQRLGLEKPEESTNQSTTESTDTTPQGESREKKPARLGSAEAAPLGEVRVDNQGNHWRKIEDETMSVTRGGVKEHPQAWEQIDPETGEAIPGRRIGNDVMNQITKQVSPKEKKSGPEGLTENSIRTELLPQLSELAGKDISTAVSISQENNVPGARVDIDLTKLPATVDPAALDGISFVRTGDTLTRYIDNPGDLSQITAAAKRRSQLRTLRRSRTQVPEK